MQRVPKQTRRVNRWNAYLHSQVHAFNQDHDPSEPRPRVHVIAKGIRERWDAMSEEERVAATADAVVELEDLRESKQAARKESKISSTRDIRNTMDGIEAELVDLHARTGAEVLVIQIRPEPENFSNRPRIFMTSPRVEEFFQLSTQRSVNDFAVKLQAFCVADIQPRTQAIPTPAELSSPTTPSTATPSPAVPAPNVQQQVIDMKRKVKIIINQKLQECAHPVKIPRINYVDFETSISERHGIVCENWPLPNFCAPGSLNSLTELEILCHAWGTGVTTFRKMSPDEHRQFKEARVQHRLQAAIAQANAATANLTAQQNATAAQFPGAGPSSSPVQRPSTPADATDHGANSKTEDAVQPTVNPLNMMYLPELTQSTSSTAEVDAELVSFPMASLSHQELVASSAMTLETPGSQPSTGLSTFAFSTGKRPPPSQFNILGPMDLMAKKPRKRRADAGVKRGPNRRTIEKNANAGADLSTSTSPETPMQEEHEQDNQSSMVAGIPSSERQVSRHVPTQTTEPAPQIQFVMPDPGGSTLPVFRVQAQPPTQPFVPSSSDPQPGGAPNTDAA